MRNGAKHIVDLAERYGFKLDGYTGLNHLLFRHPSGVKYVAPSKVTCPRTLKNMEAELKKKLRTQQEKAR